ncbi:MAG: type II toxin-antitoxin system HicB family antitoxin [Nanoarchaeota archaeon]
MENPLSCNVSLYEEMLENGKKAFVVDCIELGISDFGDTIDEALDNLREAIKLLLEEAPEKRELLEKPKQILSTRLDL